MKQKLKIDSSFFSHLHVCIFIYVDIFCGKQLCNMSENAQDKYINIMIFSIGAFTHLCLWYIPHFENPHRSVALYEALPDQKSDEISI